MTYKVLLDTNVLIATSTYINDEQGISIKHHFFDRSISLLRFIEKHLSKRIGIITTTIEEEARYELDQAVKDELKAVLVNRPSDYEIFSAIQNICEDKLNYHISLLRREPTDPTKVMKHFLDVTSMCDSLMATGLPAPAQFLSSITPRAYRGMARYIYESQDRRINYQLTNLLRKPMEASDRKILAEAIYLFQHYKETEGSVVFYIASTDYHFSPVRKNGIESRSITQTIEDKFGIICDWPDFVDRQLRKAVK